MISRDRIVVSVLIGLLFLAAIIVSLVGVINARAWSHNYAETNCTVMVVFAANETCTYACNCLIRCDTCTLACFTISVMVQYAVDSNVYLRWKDVTEQDTNQTNVDALLLQYTTGYSFECYYDMKKYTSVEFSPYNPQPYYFTAKMLSIAGGIATVVFVTYILITHIKNKRDSVQL